MAPNVKTILTINVGSTSVKLALFDGRDPVVRLAAVALERPDAALDLWSPSFAEFGDAPAAVVHRIVHGGEEFAEPVVLTPHVVERLRRVAPLAPDHLPAELEAIAEARRAFPTVRQVACFDTAFHRDMPDVARLYPLPRAYRDAGVRRYGFHGLSCESILDTLREIDAVAASGRIVVAHLGGGSSLTAVRKGRSVDTTMGFSPAGGLMMGRRSGDLDPGVLVYLLTEAHLDANAVRRLVTQEAGLAGMTGGTADMRALLGAEQTDPKAAAAITLYCYLAKKALGGLIAVLGGLDTLVFTGGIGEHAAPVRQRIIDGLANFGLQLDPARNDNDAAVISREGAPVTVRVIATAEDRVLAKHALECLERLP